jgi:NitT/TauT family transport system substrate-binding protein
MTVGCERLAGVYAGLHCDWGTIMPVIRTLVRHGKALPALAFIMTSLLIAPSAAQGDARIRLQLMWQHQAQFAGIYAAVQKGFYERERLRVELIEGGPGINPVDVLAKGKADVALAWLPSAIDARVHGRDVVNIAQIFQKPGMSIVCRRDAGIHGVSDIAGKTFGVWNVGDELDVRYWLRSIKVPPDRVNIVQQRADGADLIERRIACATAMMYNEYWSILHAGAAPGDLLHVRFGEIGLGFLEDGLYVNASSLRDARRHEQLVRFLRATLAGWTYARDNVDEALTIVMAMAPKADAAHQRRMLESVLHLLGDPKKMGLLDLAGYAHSIDVVAGEPGGAELVRKAGVGWTHEIWRTARPEGFLELSDATRQYLMAVVSSRWFYLLDLIGTAAFGFAGFMRAQQRRYDLWGALILTLLPAVAGGTLRDLLIGGDRHPPFIFKDPMYAYVVLGTVIVGTLMSRWLTPQTIGSRNFERALAIFDTVGMATFAVIGAQVAIIAGLNWVWVPFCAALTCAGGGMLLDIITGREPRTFQGEPYEEIAVVGGVIMLLGLNFADHFEHAPWMVTATIVVTLVSVFTMRMLVIRFGLRSYRLGRPGTA